MISIIIPTKNEEEYLPKLLDSIKKQSFQNFEIIIADANSTDKTVEVAKSYGCRVVKGGNPSKGRNQGAECSKGDILLFIDADVILPQSFLKNTIKEFNKENFYVAGTLQLSIPTGNKLKDLKYAFLYGIANKLIKLTQKTKKPNMHVCMFAKKEIHKKLEGFDETLIFGEDSNYARKAIKIGKFGILKSSKVKISPRRFEKQGSILILKNLYFIIGMFFGHEFRENHKIKYFNY